jgi:hypothetical protein
LEGNIYDIVLQGHCHESTLLRQSLKRCGIREAELAQHRPQLRLSKEHIQALADECKNLEHEIKLKQAYMKQKRSSNISA